MKREPDSIQEVWQITTSTALFGRLRSERWSMKISP
jgi:hypothetical protein